MTLCNQLDAHLDNDLKDHIKHSEAKKEKTLKSWINVVHHLDETQISKNKCHQELIEESLNQCHLKCQVTDANALHNETNRNCHNYTSSSSTDTTSSSSYVPLPTLLDSEHTLLNEHKGCMKCRKLYVSHRSRDCPTGFPRGKGHKTLSITDVLTTKRSKYTSTTVPPAKSTSKLVAATVPSSNKPSTIAAILPLVNDHSSDSEEDNDLSVCAMSVPVKSKHLIWHCQIHGLTNDFPVKTCALIDNGVHMVLIHPKLITKLNLKKHCLLLLHPVFACP